MDKTSKTVELLKKMADLIVSNDDAFTTIYDNKTEIIETIRMEIDIIPLLSDKYEKVRSEFERLESDVSEDDVSKDKFLNFLWDAVIMLETTMRESDFYCEYNEYNDCWEPIFPKSLISNRIISLDDEYDKFFDKIRKGESFALVRSGDGEYALAIGKKVTAQEAWESPEYVSELGRAIIDSFKLDYENFYYGISCPCCDPSGYFWYLNQIKNTNNITFANLWVNHNYRRFIKDFESIEKDAVVIANHRGAGKKIGNLNVLKYYSVTDDCVSFWENGAKDLIEKIAEENKSRKGLLYVVSAGPLANPIIAALYKRNPDNIYIDFGSSIDKYIHEKATRPYMNPDTYYGNKICWMPRPDRTTKPAISVVMSLYKRPDILVEQLEAIENQTIKPSEILLFQDKIENGVYFIELAEEIKKRFTNVRICTENKGVWGRFEYAKNVAKGEYVCIFDDDTMPGKRWLENCYMHMQQCEGIYVTLGIWLQTDSDYPYRNYHRIGWANPSQENIEVDFGGHAWFVKKEYLDRMFEDSDEFRMKYKYVGEDAYLSYNNLKKDNVRTIVPIHYHTNKDLWGSMPEKAEKYGFDANALSMVSENMEKMHTAIKELVGNGWNRLVKKDRYEEKHFEK